VLYGLAGYADALLRRIRHRKSLETAAPLQGGEK